MMQMPGIKSCHALRTLGGAVCILDLVCVYASAALRWRAQTVTHKGKTEQFMRVSPQIVSQILILILGYQDVLNSYHGSTRETAVVLNAPFYLMSAYVFP